MKIAICLSGLVRSYRDTYENFINHLINPNKHHHLDIFISTWVTEDSNMSMERTRRLAWYGENTPAFAENPIDYNDLQVRYRPVAMTIEQHHHFDPLWYGPSAPINVSAFMAMVYKIHSCDLLRQRQEILTGPYDLVVRTRFDQLLPNVLELEKFDRSVITVPSMDQHCIHEGHQWTNDKFAIAVGSMMTIYSSWAGTIKSLVADGLPMQPEILLHAHLTRNNLMITELGYELPLIRMTCS